MPYGWIDPDVALFHRGVTVWYTYQDDSIDSCCRDYWYTLNETACEGDGQSQGVFDIRDLAVYDDERGHDDILREAIDNHELPWWAFQDASPRQPLPTRRVRDKIKEAWGIE